jgi:hypothetical protein
MNKFSVSAVELNSRLEQQSTAVLAFAAVASLAATNAHAVQDDKCGNLQNEPCEEASCSIFRW